MAGIDSLTAMLIDQSTIMANSQLKGEFAVKTLNNTLDQQEQAALKLLQSIPVSGPRAPGTGELLDIVA